MMIQFNKHFNCEYGIPEELSPGIRRVVASNPGPFTFHGTGTYIVGRGRVAIIDPGPDDPAHIKAVADAVGSETVTHILVTHTHLDHSPAAKPLKEMSGAPVLGFGPHGEGRYLRGDVVEAGADHNFVPDVRVRDGDIVEGTDWSLECVHTPGHTSNHVCYQSRECRTLFCGDHVMAWSTSIISPPDGDLSEYLVSLARLLDRDDKRYLPCHGPSIDDPKPFVQSYIDHRHRRIEEVTHCLAQGVNRIGEMVEVMYHDIDPRMYPAAAHSVLSTLIYLIDQGHARSDTISLGGRFERA